MPPRMPPLTRRTMLCQLGTAGLVVAMRPLCSWSAPEAVQQAIEARIGTRQPLPQGMTLTLPKVAETGNSVSLTVAVDSPMTPAAHVLRIHIFVGGNPEPVAATYHLGVRAGRAEIT